VRHTDAILASSDSPVLGNGRPREGVFGQGTTKERIVVECLLTISQLRLTESFLSDISAKLRSAINPACPINKLPPEILTRCFLYLVPYFPLTIGPTMNQNEWIRVTHVCKYWRAVAINFSGLWNRIEFTRPEILEMYLKRSGSKLLEVCLQNVGHRFRQAVGPHTCDKKMLNMLVPLGSQIRSLIIHKDRLALRGSCNFLEGCLPNLDTLSITSNIGWENESEVEPETRLMALFKGGLPNLARLFIPECTPWPHNDFKGLKFICLYNQSALECEIPELLEMLRGSPDIEELHIRQHEASEWILDFPPDLGPIFQARSLKKLRLHNFSNKAIVCILSTMQLQPNGVAVNISDTEMAEDTFAQIIPLFPPGCTLGSTERLEVLHDFDGQFGIIFYGTGGLFKICGSLTWFGEDDRTESAISLLECVYRECAQNLKELWIHNSDNKGEGYGIFDNFSCFNLEKLSLVGGRGVSDRLCEVLDPRNPGIRGVPAPRLRSLAIEGIYEQSQLKRLIALCEDRSKTDHPLHEVSVWSSENVPDWMARLCGSAPTTININIGEWVEVMELPTVCDYSGPWWRSWDDWVDGISGYGD